VATIEELVRSINRDLSPQFEKRLRAALADEDREWLIDQLVRLTMDEHSPSYLDRAAILNARARRRAERVTRVKAMAIDAPAATSFTTEHSGFSREGAIAGGLLLASAPIKGTSLLLAEHRTEAGEALLLRAKDTLFALLFGDASTATSLERVQQELLTLALPRAKAESLDFMRASTELAAAGTWQDPEKVSSDERAEIVLLEVQYADTPDEIVGNAIVAALSVINNLEINEQVLYARMINIEESTLIT
jgi:hypothetical protein